MTARRAVWLLAAPATLAVTLLLGVPVGDTFSSTFGGEELLGQYRAFFGSRFRRAVLVGTTEIALVTTVLSLLIGFVAAWVVSRAPGRWKRVLIVAAVFPPLTGVVVRSFAWLAILGREGIVNETLLALRPIAEPLTLLHTRGAGIVAMAVLFVPLMILTITGVLEGIDDDCLDAAAPLGAMPFARFRQVVFPLAVPGLIAGAVLVFTGSFASCAMPQLPGGERQMMMGTFLYPRAMVSFDRIGASTVAAVMTALTVAVVRAMSRVARRLNPAAA